MRFTPTGVGTMPIGGRPGQALPVHPHGRGDNIARATALGLYGLRFTPTGVGTIARCGERGRRAAVHPHGRGDNGARYGWRAGTGGSPPRAWGQFPVRGARRIATRFTPTGVGTIAPAPAPVRRRAVHPHGRGDNHISSPTPTVSGGSPPRAWGQLNGILWTWDRERFTPTGVGTIGVVIDRVVVSTVHPHGRGDNDAHAHADSDRDGSPPRAWGQYGSSAGDTLAIRFTPTGVGTIAHT